jgi:TRAP-type C4-dicarboxylate transport system permease small subunit
MQKLLTKINRLTAELGGLLMTIMMVLFLVNILSREMNRPIQGLLQMAVFAMVILIYLGLAHCEENDEHVRLEVVMTRLPLKMRTWVRFFCTVTELLIVSLLLYAGARDAMSAFTTGASVTGTRPMLLWPVKTVMVAGLVLFWFQLLSKSIAFLREKSNSAA